MMKYKKSAVVKCIFSLSSSVKVRAEKIVYAQRNEPMVKTLFVSERDAKINGILLDCRFSVLCRIINLLNLVL